MSVKRAVKSKVKSNTNTKKTKSVSKEIDAKMNSIIEDAEKRYGINVLRKGFPREDLNEWYNLKRFSTSVPSLDISLGGGIPIGRYTEIQGAEHVGKTTLALHILREFQHKFKGLIALVADCEESITPSYLEDLEIEEDQFLYNPSSGLEETTQLILDQMVKGSKVKLALIDSVEALVPTKEYESSMDDSTQLGMKPKLMAEFFRKFNAANNKLMREGEMPMTLIGINQLRDKIGVYGNPEFAPGGNAKNFAQSICIRLRRGDFIFEGSGDNKVQVGHEVKFKIQKNKTFSTGKTGSFHLYTEENDSGIKRLWVDIPLSISLAAIKMHLIERKGSYFYLVHNPDIQFQGKQAMFDYLAEHPEVTSELQDIILKELTKR